MTRNATRQIAAIIGTNIAQARADQGLTQKELALRIGAGPDQVSKWERGEHRPERYLHALCAALNRELAWFYAEHEPAPKAAA